MAEEEVMISINRIRDDFLRAERGDQYMHLMRGEAIEGGEV
jgi:hypothetical protein